MSNLKFSNWRVSQKYIRINHNKAVNLYFRDLEDFRNKVNLKNSILIYKKDTATQCLVKMQFFEQYVREYGAITPVIPEWWQVRKGANVPQLSIVFASKKANKDGSKSKWSLALPHFVNNPDKLKHLTGYKKGSIQGMVTLKDNSKIIIYAKSATEARNTLKKWIDANLFDSDFLDKKDYFVKTGQIKKVFKEVEVIPTYAKYFSTGQLNLVPDWTSKIESK